MTEKEEKSCLLEKIKIQEIALEQKENRIRAYQARWDEISIKSQLIGAVMGLTIGIVIGMLYL